MVLKEGVYFLLNPSEEIVTSWLHERGFFVRNNLKVGQNEIDILAVNPAKEDKMHCEISVQVSPVGHVVAGSKEPLEKAKQRSLADRVKGFHQRKFVGKNGKVEKTAEQLLGKGYRKLFVCGNLNRFEEGERERIIQELKKYGVEVKFFSEILVELKGKIRKKGYKDNPSRYIQLMKHFSSEPETLS